jgi:hypothetical protein
MSSLLQSMVHLLSMVWLSAALPLEAHYSHSQQAHTITTDPASSPASASMHEHPSSSAPTSYIVGDKYSMMGGCLVVWNLPFESGAPA